VALEGDFGVLWWGVLKNVSENGSENLSLGVGEMVSWEGVLWGWMGVNGGGRRGPTRLKSNVYGSENSGKCGNLGL